jgi:hypothetical protein
MMPVFALTEVAGPAWDPARGRREQNNWDEHAAFIDGSSTTASSSSAAPSATAKRSCS